jgi:GAF domain-containing protein
MSFAGFPVQILRAANAILIAFGIVYGMRVFNIEEHKLEERRSMELLALENISREIGRNPDLSKALMWAIREIIRLFDAKAGAVIMVGEQTGRPNIEVEHGFVPGFAQGFERMSSVDAEKCPVGRVIKEQKPFVTTDMAECPLMVEAVDGPEKVNAVTLLPLTAKTKTFGAIALLFEDVEALKPSNVEFLSTFANQIGLAVENAQLEEQRRIGRVVRSRN